MYTDIHIHIYIYIYIHILLCLHADMCFYISLPPPKDLTHKITHNPPPFHLPTPLPPKRKILGKYDSIHASHLLRRGSSSS